MADLDIVAIYIWRHMTMEQQDPGTEQSEH